MQAWTEFYAVIGAAAATLLGLLFVSVSLNAAAIMSAGQESSKRLAEQAFQNYVAVILVSLLALFPQMKTSTYGGVVICVTIVSSAWVLIRLWQAVTGPTAEERSLFALRRHFTSLIGFAMMIGAAVGLAMNWGDYRDIFAAATIVLLVSATTVSWELLVKIAARAPAA